MKTSMDDRQDGIVLIKCKSFFEIEMLLTFLKYLYLSVFLFSNVNKHFARFITYVLNITYKYIQTPCGFIKLFLKWRYK